MIPHLAFYPPIIAHRGAGSDAPENTLAAIHATNASGINWIEIDIKITYDGVPILMHDDTIDRTTTGSGAVAEMNWADLQKVKIKSDHFPNHQDETIPWLPDVVRAIVDHKMSLIAEIKPCPGRSRATTMVSIIELAKIWPERGALPVISSFDIESLETAGQLEPHWPRCLSFDKLDSEWRAKVERVGACAMAIKEDVLTRDFVDEVNRLRLPLLAYTVNDPLRAKELLAWGVSAVYADCPHAILKQL